LPAEQIDQRIVYSIPVTVLAARTRLPQRAVSGLHGIAGA